MLRKLSIGHKAELRSQGPALVAALERAMRTTKGGQGSAQKLFSDDPERPVKHDRISSPGIRGDGCPGRRHNAGRTRPIPHGVGLTSLGAIGLTAGGIAFLLYKLIGLFTNLFFYGRFAAEFTSARHNHLGWWVILVPVIGGLIVGVMAKYGSSKIKGHGIPEAMEAVLFNRSRIQPRVAILKPISAAIAIGTGGPFGAEGPIIQTGGAVGSLVGQIFHTTASERKVLLACGAAAGMSATFNTPIAGVILAIELLLFEFKSRSFIPLVIASTLATAVHMQLLGAGPMFTVTAMDFGIPQALPFYLLLGVVCGLAAVGFSKLLYWTEDQFEKLPVDELWWPAIGALGLGHDRLLRAAGCWVSATTRSATF